LVIIGGAEDKIGPCIILRELVRLAGGGRARVATLPLASSYSDLVGARYAALFSQLGAAETFTVDLLASGAVATADTLGALERATAVFFTGGDQRRITRVLSGSPAALFLQQRLSKGLVLGGTSAGAAAMSCSMLSEERGPLGSERRWIEQSNGLGFLPGAIVDQHFTERCRLKRLRWAVARQPEHLGLGIDENTAVVVQGETFDVLGSGSVTVVDASGSRLADSGSFVNFDEHPADYDDSLHILTPGQRFDLRRRRPVPTRDGTHDRKGSEPAKR